MKSIAENLEQVQERIREACRACGRDAEDVELIAVSKKKEVPALREAVSAGQTLLGENRIQEAMAKQPELPGSIRWHLIGHLQSNKVKQAIHCQFDCIHSVDSTKLMLALNEEAGQQGIVQPILLQVNISGEVSKFGLSPEDLLPLLEQATRCMHLDVQGLMTIPPFTEDPEKAGPFFAALRNLRDQAANETGFPLTQLSMGMSHDLEVAIREGATWVRVGTDIFGARS
ncbi:MAG: YggS family pyridoxal phosphate-dependent enzyme [Kiritimatiellae bacterium]|jgi:pyridoxal phosphate enzyme (YggS family)|nr:YggS family pyridoxal phosphate-dependent enzyme [Kiritimatiellia bacterium]